MNKPTLDEIQITWEPSILSKVCHKIFSHKRKYTLSKWLVNLANGLILASPKDGYIFVDTRTSAWSKLHVETQADLVQESLETVSSFPSTPENVHQQVRQQILDLLTLIVEEGGLRYEQLDIPQKHIDTTTERIIGTVEQRQRAKDRGIDLEAVNGQR